MGKILIGWAEESLVPDKKVNLYGQFFERISQYVESEITATAMAIEVDGEQAIIVSVDILDLNKAQLDYIREKVAKLNSEIDISKIIVGATHTHTSIGMGQPNSGVSAAGFANEKTILEEFLPKGKRYSNKVTADDSVITPEEALEFGTDRIAKAIVNAWNNRKEALYTNEFGRAAVGMCRRATYDDGSAQMWGDTNTANFVALEGGNDSGVELIYTFDKNKKLTGVVANIACPAQVLEQRSFISADFWGRAKAIVREKLGKDIYLVTSLPGSSSNKITIVSSLDKVVKIEN